LGWASARGARRRLPAAFARSHYQPIGRDEGRRRLRPLEPAHPGARSAYIIADAELELIITQSGVAEGLPESAARALLIDAEWGRIAEQSAANLTGRAAPEETAYVIYTSGSTGSRRRADRAPALVNYIGGPGRHMSGLAGSTSLVFVAGLRPDGHLDLRAAGDGQSDHRSQLGGA